MKKAQSIVVAFISILVIAILFIQLFLSEYDKLSPAEGRLDEMESEAIALGKRLAGPASPPSWNDIEDIDRIGLLKSGLISKDTLEKYSTLPYYRTKLRLGMRNDYLFFFLNDSKVVKIGGNEYWGWRNGTASGNGGDDFNATISLINSFSSYLSNNERFIKLNVSSEPEIMKLVVYVWSI